MYYNKFINFLRQNNLYDVKSFSYWKKNRILFDYQEREKRDLIGCFYQFNKNNILKEIKLIVPYLKNDKTVLINIHEFIHMLLLYPKLNKKCEIGIDKEILPIFYERLFIEQENTKELYEYYQYLNQYITNSNQLEYILAMNLSEQVKDIYPQRNIYILEKKVKRLVKQHNSY